MEHIEGVGRARQLDVANLSTRASKIGREPAGLRDGHEVVDRAVHDEEGRRADAHAVHRRRVLV